MPELPEVETARKHLAKFCEGKRIRQIITREEGHGPRHGLFDDIIFEQAVPDDVKLLSANLAPTNLKRDKSLSAKEGKKALTRKKTEDPSTATVTASSSTDSQEVENIYQGVLKNRWVQQVCRKGKQLWVELGSNRNTVCTKEEEKLALLLHFGMTGSIVVKGERIPCYKAFHVVENEEWPPRFTKLELVLDNGDENETTEPVRVALCDPRRLGYVKLRVNPKHTDPIKTLAYDPLTDELPSIADLTAQFNKSQTNIKTLLLNQEKIFSGIGNYLADEILYQAKIHPLTVASEINEAGIAMLVEKMKYIIQTAADCDANYEDFPKDWIFHYRWDKGKSDAVRHMPNGNLISYETINGRTTAIVLKEQTKNGYYRKSSSVDTDEVAKEEVENENPTKSSRKGRAKKGTVEDVKVEEVKVEPTKPDDNATQASVKKGRKRKSEEADTPLPPVPPSNAKIVKKQKTSKTEEQVNTENEVKIEASSGRRKRKELEAPVDPQPAQQEVLQDSTGSRRSKRTRK